MVIGQGGIFLRSKKQTLEFLIEDLRISELTLRDLNTSVLEEWIPNAPKSSSIKMLTTTLKTLK